MIDKSIRQHYDNKYSAKNRRRYFTGAYGGEEAGRGRDDPPSNSGGNDHPDQGWQTYVEPSPPVRSTPSPHVDTAADLIAEATRMEAERKAIESIITDDTDDTDGRSAAKIQQFVNPRRKEIITHTAHSDIPVKTIVPDKKLTTTYGTSVTDPYGVPKESFWDSGIGKALKVGTALVAPQIAAKLGVGEAYRFGKLGYDIKQRKGLAGKTVGYLEKKTGKKFKIPGVDTQKQATRKLVKGMPEMLGDRGFRTRETPKDDGSPDIKTVAEQITKGAGLESGQEMLGLNADQIKQLYDAQSLLRQTLKAGMYQGQRLTADQIKMLQGKQMELNNLIEAIEKAQAPVHIAYGGSVDKALTGRNRDI